MPVKNEAFKIICKGSDREPLRILRIETDQTIPHTSPIMLNDKSTIYIDHIEISHACGAKTLSRDSPVALDDSCLQGIPLVLEMSLCRPR